MLKCEQSLNSSDLYGIWQFYSKTASEKTITHENKLLNTHSKGMGTLWCSLFVNYYSTSQTHPHKTPMFPFFSDFFYPFIFSLGFEQVAFYKNLFNKFCVQSLRNILNGFFIDQLEFSATHNFIFCGWILRKTLSEFTVIPLCAVNIVINVHNVIYINNNNNDRCSS